IPQGRRIHPDVLVSDRFVHVFTLHCHVAAQAGTETTFACELSKAWLSIRRSSAVIPSPAKRRQPHFNLGQTFTPSLGRASTNLYFTRFERFERVYLRSCPLTPTLVAVASSWIKG